MRVQVPPPAPHLALIQARAAAQEIRIDPSDLKEAAPEDYGVLCPDEPVVVDCDNANTSPCWTIRSNAQGAKGSRRVQNILAKYSTISGELPPMKCGRPVIRSRIAWRSRVTQRRQCSSVTQICSVRTKSGRVSVKCSNADGSGENRNRTTRASCRRQCANSQPFWRTRTVHGQFEQKRKGADCGLPFNLRVFYEFVGCGGWI